MQENMIVLDFIADGEGKGYLLSELHQPFSAHGFLKMDILWSQLEKSGGINRFEIYNELHQMFIQAERGWLITLKINRKSGGFILTFNSQAPKATEPFKRHFDRWLKSESIDADVADYELKLAKRFYHQGKRDSELEQGCLNVELSDYDREELDRIIQYHQESDAPNEFHSLNDLATYVLSAIADGSRRPGSWERSIIESLGIVASHPDHQVHHTNRPTKKRANQ
jgi:hypothetical protein